MQKILIANRGEIALRVMRACKEMGIQTVAVFSEADRNALHTRYADEAVCIGPPPSSQSYLLGDKIIEVAKRLGVDGIHPGYGFLSENASFARKVREAGMIFIGPSPESMETMGSKIGAKQAVRKFGVPLVPGIDEAIKDVAGAKKIADSIGYPVLIKASAGGGGKGMRVVNEACEFEEQIHMAQGEARSAFGDDAVFIEKYVAAPRHIEFQIMADNHGNVVHLFERECSIQRRHQKLVEEAPSACLTPEMRREMGDAAVNAAKACNYSGAGTIEFLVDEGMNFYFLEMNTRLQVEHPVTEQITGIDLVKEQIKVARGEKLSFTQEDLKINGHSIELRICAEDPANNFLPDIGKLMTYKTPQGFGVRVDDSFEQGMEIPIHYDPMIAKLIVHADTREAAMSKMLQAIADYHISGIETTLPFGAFVMNHEAFRSGKFDTKFIDKYFTPEHLFTKDGEADLVAALVGQEVFDGMQTLNQPDSHLGQRDGANTNRQQNSWQRNRTELR
ncbi:MAG: acetyl-CoA carboxylase biotin carboxylase subunit [Flavobacteriaceae bacterium]|nr:acetyl-CoA carboxylase biotin carboxylase subunit [Flavobacteriaceae bacterium]